MPNHSYGWLPQLPDHRDFTFGVTHTFGATAPNPPAVDLRPSIDWVYDQGREQSCSAQSTSSLNRFVRKLNKQPLLLPSRNFLYWQARNIEGTTLKDAGCYIRDAFKSLANIGVPPEESWDYNINTLYATPPVALYSAAANNKVSTYVALNQDHNDLQTCLAQGYPFVFGIEVFSAFESDAVAANGIVPMPTATDQVLGGHAIMCVGYNNTTQLYTFMNSWGSGWGDKGFGYLPYAFVESNLSSDFWTMR
jgi:C1A family cysteine protease